MVMSPDCANDGVEVLAQGGTGSVANSWVAIGEGAVTGRVAVG